jgi:phosphoadenosine phosphosulfate reductase
MSERAALIDDLAENFAVLSLEERLTRVRERLDGRIIFTTSFGLEDQAISHAICTRGLDIALITLDTGRLFSETYALWAATEERYGRRIDALYPNHKRLAALIAQQGINGFYHAPENRHACCQVRKVEPLGRALKGAAVWIAGLRGEQSAERADAGLIAYDAARGLIKVNPLFDWSRERLAAYVADARVPYNSLHDQGFASIGCQPCTRALKPGEPERAGRWWWEEAEKKECGLHQAEDGRLVRQNA